MYDLTNDILLSQAMCTYFVNGDCERDPNKRARLRTPMECTGGDLESENKSLTVNVKRGAQGIIGLRTILEDKRESKTFLVL